VQGEIKDTTFEGKNKRNKAARSLLKYKILFSFKKNKIISTFQKKILG